MSMPNMMNPLTNPAALAMGRGLFPPHVQPLYGELVSCVTIATLFTPANRTRRFYNDHVSERWYVAL